MKAKVLKAVDSSPSCGLGQHLADFDNWLSVDSQDFTFPLLVTRVASTSFRF